MRVEISYKPTDSAEYRELRITASQYFAPRETARGFVCDDKPQHPRLIDYLPIPADRVDEVVLRISDTGQVELTQRELFWNAGQNRIVERRRARASSILVTLRDGAVEYNARIERGADGGVQVELADQAGARQALLLSSATAAPAPTGARAEIWHRSSGAPEWRTTPLEQLPSDETLFSLATLKDSMPQESRDFNEAELFRFDPEQQRGVALAHELCLDGEHTRLLEQRVGDHERLLLELGGKQIAHQIRIERKNSTSCALTHTRSEGRSASSVIAERRWGK